MAELNQPGLLGVDWNKLPTPVDDGSADHLTRLALPSIRLSATSGPAIDLSSLAGRAVVFAYPMTGRPDIALPDNWDMTPGARGCTPQACAFRDAKADLVAAGASHIFGLSVQDTVYQQEAAERLHLPYPLLSDEDGELRKALNLPVMAVENMVLLKRLTMVIKDGRIEKVWYPVFPPDQSVEPVLVWLENQD